MTEAFEDLGKDWVAVDRTLIGQLIAAGNPAMFGGPRGLTCCPGDCGSPRAKPTDE